MRSKVVVVVGFSLRVWIFQEGGNFDGKKGGAGARGTCVSVGTWEYGKGARSFSAQTKHLTQNPELASIRRCEQLVK